MGLTGILLAITIVVLLTLVVILYRRAAGKGSGGAGCPPSPSNWSAVKDSWAQLRGGVLNMVVADRAGSSSTTWVTRHAPHGKGGSMTRDDAHVCEKACVRVGVPPLGRGLLRLRLGEEGDRLLDGASASWTASRSTP